MFRFLATAAILVVLSLPALAQGDAPAVVATATQVSGPVQVNQGERFVPLQAGAALQAGDRVMALSEGSATLRFADGCELRVAPESMITVPATSTCKGAVVVAQSTAPGSSGAVGAGAGTPTHWGSAALIAGIVAVGNAIMYAESEQNTASP